MQKHIDVTPLVERFGSKKERDRLKATFAASSVVCDRCNFHGSLAALQRHMKEAHPSVEEKAARAEDANRTQRLARASRKEQQKQKQMEEYRALAATREREWREREAKRGRVRQLAKAHREKLIDDLMRKSECAPKPLSQASQIALRPEPFAPTPVKPLAADLRRKMTLREALVAQGVIKVAAKQVSAPWEKRAAAATPEKKPPIRCPLCNKNVAADRTKLERHFDSKHPIESPEPMKRRAHSPKDKRKKEQPSSAPENEQKPKWQETDLMDANRGMGHFARDNGRFGSHALHDRFDDESAP